MQCGEANNFIPTRNYTAVAWHRSTTKNYKHPSLANIIHSDAVFFTVCLLMKFQKW